jgi:uncharacterized protein (UPF0216 family)
LKRLTLREEIENEIDHAIRRIPLALEVLTASESEAAGRTMNETEVFQLSMGIDVVRRDAILRLADEIDAIKSKLKTRAVVLFRGLGPYWPFAPTERGQARQTH